MTNKDKSQEKQLKTVTEERDMLRDQCLYFIQMKEVTPEGKASLMQRLEKLKKQMAQDKSTYLD